MDPSTIRVLMVGDRTGLASEIRRLLHERVDILLEALDDSVVALDVARAVRPDLIFLEWDISGSPGLEFLETFGRTSGLSEVPVIMLAEGTHASLRSASSRSVACARICADAAARSAAAASISLA